MWIIFGLGTMLAVVSWAQSARPTVTVCDLIREPEKWESKLVALRGSLEVGESSQPDLFLVSVPREKCAYPNSSYSDSTELARIGLQDPDVHFLANAPPGFNLIKTSLWDALDRIAYLRKQDSALKRVSLTVQGLVTLRKYRIETSGARLAEHVPFPVTLIVESWSVERINQ